MGRGGGRDGGGVQTTHSDSSKGFWTIPQKPDIFQTYGFCKKLEYRYYFHIQVKTACIYSSLKAVCQSPNERNSI